MPPPEPVAWLPLMVLLFTVSAPPCQVKIPPPLAALLPLTTLLVKLSLLAELSI
jgi:hypothetical protein